MMPIGPLMIEHRLIERMLVLMQAALRQAEHDNRVSDEFITMATHFIRAYADRCHHGKEEDILFRALEQKPLSEEHQRTLQELVEEHQWARKHTSALVDANARHENGDREALSEIVHHLRLLIHFYPQHIEKEDKHFFIPIMAYFADHEKEALLQAGYAFDSRLIHEEYAGMVSSWEEGADRT